MTTTHLNVSGYAVNWPQERAKWKHLKDLDLPVVKTSIVSVLLGVDCFSLIVPREVREGKQGTPSAVRTKLGWTVTSSLPSSCAPGNEETLNVCHVSRQERADDALHQLVKDWWSTDSFGTTATVSRSQAEQKALAALDANTKWVGCRYQTGLLWKSEDICLPDNRQTAEARLRSTEKSLTETQSWQQSTALQ